MLHRAWTFDPVAFHASLQKDIIRAGRLKEDRLRTVAMDAARQDNPVVLEYLEMLRLDPAEEESWASFFEKESEDEVLADRWYVVAMGPYLTPSPGFSGWNWQSIQSLLVRGGWEAMPAAELVHGWSLQSLVNAYAHDSLLAQVGRHLSNYIYGGWLSEGAAKSLLWTFDNRPFLEDIRANPDRYGIHPDLTPDPDFHQAIAEPLQEARRMLTVAVERKAAIRMGIYG